jgi:dienelactone hydrolase
LLKSKGVAVQLVEIPGVDHSFIGPNPAVTKAASLQALRRTFEFIDQVSGASGLPGTSAR